MDKEFLETIAEKLDEIKSELQTISFVSLDGIDVNLSAIGDAIKIHNKLLKQQNVILSKIAEKLGGQNE